MTNRLQAKTQMIKLELLGIGSKRYLALFNSLQKVLKRLDLDIPINEIREIDQILAYDIIGIPALCVNGEFLYQSDVPTEEELEAAFRKLLGKDI